MPVEAPEGTAARPMAPSSRYTSTSTVGLPRLSRISRPRTTTISIICFIVVQTPFVCSGAAAETASAAKRECNLFVGAACGRPDTQSIWGPVLFEMLGGNKFRLRQGFRHWRKHLYGAKRRPPEAGTWAGKSRLDTSQRTYGISWQSGFSHPFRRAFPGP